jgi:hypothetical protein
MKNFRLGFLSITAFAISVLSLLLSFHIGERFFFDRLFYQKSQWHGYFSCGKDNCPIESFLSRSSGLLDLERLSQQMRDGEVLGIDTNQIKINVGVVGDSYTWGTGVRSNQTFISKLKNKLEQNYKIALNSYATPGNNVMQHYQLVEFITLNNLADWVIIVPTSSDIFVSSNDWYDQFLPTNNRNIIEHYCRDITGQDFTYDFIDDIEDPDDYPRAVTQAWDNKANQCLVEQFLLLLASTGKQVMFFFPDLHSDCENAIDPQCNYVTMVKSFSFPVYTLTDVSRDECCNAMFPSETGKLRVSAVEGHPSALAHEIYFRFLSKYLINKVNSVAISGI